jgi:hypothetical protein
MIEIKKRGIDSGEGGLFSFVFDLTQLYPKIAVTDKATFL